MNNKNILESTVKELQGQLQAAYMRIGVLTEELNIYKSKYRNKVDEHFDQKMKQKSMTELNFDGNETRGRYGEDESV
jgi:hypothetical protein|tara:strand:- start:215 stop:445 length:231 start_codon:yes stop_codon:yes gene_type:complete